MSDVPEVIQRFLSAWTERDPTLAAQSVTEGVLIRDPNQSVQGAGPLVEHLEVILRRFDFAITYGPCLREGDLVAFTCSISMVGRSSRLAGVKAGFDPAVFVELRDDKIASWTEYWDPAPLARALASP